MEITGNLVGMGELESLEEFNVGPVGIVLSDADGRCVQILGLTRDEIVKHFAGRFDEVLTMRIGEEG